MQTTFSIIIPTYNRGYILWKTIQSIQKQTYPFWEIIVVDDGSTDDTAKVVAEFQDDPRIKYFKIKNSGVSHARNIGMQHASGEIITYLDSDDRFYDNCLTLMMQHFEKYPDTIFAIPDYNFRVELYEDNKLIDFTRTEQRHTNDMTLQDIYHWKAKCAFGTGMFHKRVVIEDGLRWDEKLELFDDWDFFMQLGNTYPEGFLHVPYALYEYHQRYGTDGKCSTNDYATFAKAFQAMYDKHKDDPLMKDQEWYPRLVEKYKEKAKLYKEGKSEPIVYKYFSKHFTRK